MYEELEPYQWLRSPSVWLVNRNRGRILRTAHALSPERSLLLSGRPQLIRIHENSHGKRKHTVQNSYIEGDSCAATGLLFGGDRFVSGNFVLGDGLRWFPQAEGRFVGHAGHPLG